MLGMRRKRRVKTPAEVVGPAKVDRRTKDLIRRLVPGDIAVIDHADIDRVAADGLIEAGVAAVVNATASISGRYPNGGPIRIVRAGIPLLDAAGTDLIDRFSDGDALRIVDGEIWCGDELVATAKVLTEPDIEAAMEDAAPRSAGSWNGSPTTRWSTSTRSAAHVRAARRCRR